MPTVLYIKGYRFFFFSADGEEPAHVHVKKGSGDAKIWLMPMIKEEYFFDFKRQEEREIIEIVTINYELLISKWNAYFGK